MGRASRRVEGPAAKRAVVFDRRWSSRGAPGSQPERRISRGAQARYACGRFSTYGDLSACCGRHSHPAGHNVENRCLGSCEGRAVWPDSARGLCADRLAEPVAGQTGGGRKSAPAGASGSLGHSTFGSCAGGDECNSRSGGGHQSSGQRNLELPVERSLARNCRRGVATRGSCTGRSPG